MSTTYRYTLPVEQTEWKFEGNAEAAFTWEYDENRAGLLQLYDKASGSNGTRPSGSIGTRTSTRKTRCCSMTGSSRSSARRSGTR